MKSVISAVVESKIIAVAAAVCNVASVLLLAVNSIANPPKLFAPFISEGLTIFAISALAASTLYTLSTGLYHQFRVPSVARRERKVFAENLMPAIQAIEDAMSSTKMDHARSIKDRTIYFLKDTIDAEDVRACFYDLGFEEGPETTDNDTPDAAELRRVLFWDNQIRGRSDPPKHKEYVDDPDDPIAKANFKALDSGEPRLISNTKKKRKDVKPNPKYRTFLNMPVWSNNTPVGMLTIDAAHPKSIDPDDVAVARVGSLILGIAISRLKTKNKNASQPSRSPQ